MMIIDIHTHAFPDALAPRAIAELSARCQVPPALEGTTADLHRSMQRAGIRYSAIMPIATKPAQVENITAWALAESRQYPDILAFSSLHPAQTDIAHWVDRFVQAGIKGIKLHPDYQQFFADDPAVFPLYREVAAAGLIVVMHCGVDIGLPPPVHATPERVARALDAVPHMTLITAHMGGYGLWDDVERYLVGRDCYLETSYSYPDLSAERMTGMMRAHGVDHVLFGTDSPWRDQTAEVAAIRSLPLGADEIKAILGGNACRLLRVSAQAT